MEKPLYDTETARLVLSKLYCRTSAPDVNLLGKNIKTRTKKTESSLLSSRVKGKGKGKAIPLQAWTRPEGSRRLRLPDFKTIGT